MGLVGSRMSGGSYITSKDVTNAVGPKRSNLPNDDAALLQYALTTVPTLHFLTSCELQIDFRSTSEPVSLTTNGVRRPRERLMFTRDHKGNPTHFWDDISIERRAAKFITEDIPSLASRLLSSAVFAVGYGLRQAIMYN